MHTLRTTHLEDVDKILMYLKKSPEQGICLKQNKTDTIIDYSYAYCADSYDRKSTTGYCMFVSENHVTWKSKKYNIIARSSVKIKYQTMTSTASKLIWIKLLL
jgi:predicted DNA binding protein